MIGWLWFLCGLVVVIDSYRRPESSWLAADRDRGFWAFCMLLLGPIGVGIYLVAVVPRFAHDAVSPEFRRQAIR